MTHTINHVRVFHELYGHPVAERLDPGTRELRELRVKLIAEELCELCEALGVKLRIDYDPALPSRQQYFAVDATGDDNQVNLVEAADALGDLDYVVQGANLVFGVPAEAVMAEIQRANLSKLGEDGKPIRREDGKIMKGPNYSPPNIRQVLDVYESQRANASKVEKEPKLAPDAGLRVEPYESYGGAD